MNGTSVAQDAYGRSSLPGVSAVRVTSIAITRVRRRAGVNTVWLMNGGSGAQDAIINPVADSNWVSAVRVTSIASQVMTFFGNCHRREYRVADEWYQRLKTAINSVADLN